MHCCVFGCGNTSKNNDHKLKGVKFYYFPTNSTHMPWLRDKRKKWINAVKKHTKHPNDWLPLKNTTICSAHFICNRKSENPQHPSYMPTIFPGVEITPQLINKKLQRFERHQRRMEQFRAEDDVEPERLVKRSVGCQYNDLLSGDQPCETYFFCNLTNLNGVCTAEIQVNIVLKIWADKSCDANISTTVKEMKEFTCDPLDLSSQIPLFEGFRGLTTLKTEKIEPVEQV